MNGALKNSIEVLKIIYMVVAGLALAKGLELFVVGSNNNFNIVWFSLPFWFFIIFITTVVRFVHGAMRHFDFHYSENTSSINWKIYQPIIDLVGLGIEAFIFFILAYSINDTSRFISYFLVLMIVDSLWLLIISLPNIKRLWTANRKWWTIANLVVIIPTGVIVLWFPSATYLTLVFFIVVVIHTVVDYPLNWFFYFNRPFYWPWKLKHRPEVLFIAGAYMNSDPKEIDRNIKLAEKFSVELWNRGYKVFCPHLNTAHFEKKAKAQEDSYKKFDMRILKHCDGVVALPNWSTSVGAKAEIDEAKRLGKPIYYSLNELQSLK